MSEVIHVLHVDDDPSQLELTAELLHREDDRLKVISKTNPNQALEYLRTDSVDCVVSDFEMPLLDGLTLLDQIRDHYPELPFILFTGKGSEEVASDAISKGVTDYLQKGGTERYRLLKNRIVDAVEKQQTKAEQIRQLHAIETAREGISVLDDTGSFIFVNQAFAELYGYSQNEMVGKHVECIFPETEIDLIYDKVLPSVEVDGYWRGETTGLRRDGTTFIEDHVVASTDDADLICTVRDVTEQKQRQAELRESEERYRTLVENTPNAIIVLHEGQVVYANLAFVELLNADDKSDVIGLSHLENIPPEYVDVVESRLEQVSQRDREEGDWIDRREGEIITLDGKTKPVEVTAAPISYEGEPAFQIIIEDISERTKREQELRREKRRFQSIFVNSHDAIMLLDPREDEIIEVNDQACRMFGYRREELLAIGPAEIHPDELEQFNSFMDSVNQEGSGWTDELTCLTSDGRRLPAEISASLIDVEESQYVMAIIRDITDRKRRREELQATERQFEAVLNNPVSVIAILSPEGILERVNHTALELIDRDVEEVEGNYFWETPWWTHSTDLQAELQTWIDRAASGEFVRFEAHHPVADGSTVHIDATVYPVVDKDGDVKCLVAVGRDVTGLKERERDLERSNAQLDEFANVVSHDLRNPLNVASGHVELLRDEVDSKHIDSIDRAIDRMNTLIEDLMALARAGQQVSEMVPVGLAEITESCWRNVETGEATLTTDLDLVIRADRTRIQQLLENLMRNVVEHAGDFTTVEFGEIHGEPGFYVADDGVGIPVEERQEVFNSGYSTNQSGTGLGLAIVEQITKAHGWEIDVTESAYGGARFEITGIDIID